MSSSAQGLAAVGRTPVLPHDRVVVRPAGLAVPHQRGLALVRDSNGGYRCSGRLEAVRDLSKGVAHRLPDLVRVVLHQARPGEVLGELALGGVDDTTGIVDCERADAGGPCVYCEHHGHTGRLRSGGTRDDTRR